jgi:kynurenine formamidase
MSKMLSICLTCCLACLPLVACSDGATSSAGEAESGETGAHAESATAAGNPARIVDLSPAITEDLPVRMVGQAMLEALGAPLTTEFVHIEGDEPFYYLDSIVTLFNHAGSHADAPAHLIPDGKSIDQIGLDHFFGPARVLDYSSLVPGEEVSLAQIQEHGIQPGDIVILYAGYQPPSQPADLPTYPVLSPEAATYLAELPVRSFGTDAPSVDDLAAMAEQWAQGATGLENLLPVHDAFLSREIPLVEGLVNLQAVVDDENVVFAGFPLKLTGRAGDAGSMRAVALVY